MESKTIKHPLLWIIMLGGCVALTLVMAYLIILSSFYDWQVTVYFNKYYEGILELILFPVFGILGSISIIKITLLLRSKTEVKKQ